jgi:hypothetical protein
LFFCKEIWERAEVLGRRRQDAAAAASEQPRRSQRSLKSDGVKSIYDRTLASSFKTAMTYCFGGFQFGA